MININNILNKTTVSAFICKIMLILSVVSIPSCSKDVLDKVPLDRFSDAAVWQDEALISAFVLGTYRSMPTGFRMTYSFAYLRCLGAFTDEAVFSLVAWDELFNAGEVTPMSNLPDLAFWELYYSTIGKCNIFLDKIQTSVIDAALKTRMTGEIKVLRAFAYFRLISFYGGVPLIKKPLTLEDDLYQPRNSYDECMAFIITELDEAAALLPLTYATAERGRITKGAALAVKSRALLYAASPLNNPGNDMNKWQKAADAAKAVIDLGVYSLYSNYKDLFLQAAAYNSEIIWARPYNNLVDFELVVIERFLYPPASNGRAVVNPIHNIVADYETLNGKLPKDDPTYNPQNPYVNRDPRFYATILYDGATFKGRQIETFLPKGIDSEESTWVGFSPTGARPGYYLRKFMDESITNPTNQNTGSTPWIFFRYAEMLLNYAEANYYLGDAAKCREYINKVRSRLGVVMPVVTESGDPLLKRLQNERRIELAFEEHRFFDVRRWKIAPVVLNINAKKMLIVKDPVTGIKTFSVVDLLPARAFFDKNYLLPIPQTEINKNANPLFTQNPGY